MLEENGVHIAAVSYDSPEILAAFARKYGIGYPLLSDRGSCTIREFGIFNYNMASDLRSYGVPHPVDFLVSPGGVVIRKYFVENYQHRVTAAAIALKEFGASRDAASVTLRDAALAVEIGVASKAAFAGQEIGFFARFALEPGWHIYGSPLPEGYTATSIVFDDPRVLRQSFQLPEPEILNIAALNERLPVYSGSFEASGSLLLKFPLPHGSISLAGRLIAQQCSDRVCEPPQNLPFELAVTLQPFLEAERKRKADQTPQQ